MRNREELLVRLMHHLSETFKDRLVLEGGMLLRLLNSQRSTQDVDYVFLSQESKKVLAKEFEKVLGRMEGVRVDDVHLHSRGVFIRVVDSDVPENSAMLEISVLPSLHRPTGHLSTLVLAGKYALGARVVTTMELSEAFANKIAAALERDSLRDLYDLSIFESLGDFDAETLRSRLAMVSIARKRPRSMGGAEAANLLRDRAERVDGTTVEQELAPLLPKQELAGLETVIRASVLRIADRIEPVISSGNG